MLKLIGLLLVLQWATSSAAASDAIEIMIVRDQNALLVKQNDRTIRRFKVALGSGGLVGKLIEGDRKTPKGQYRILEVRDSDLFHIFMQLNYPNLDDARLALKDGRINRSQYRKILGAHIYNEMPPQNTPLGGAIGIHGLGEETAERLKIHELINWTKGCIAMRNSEIRALQQYIEVGTLVTIVNSLP